MQTFALAPSGPKPVWFIALILVVVVIALAMSFASLRRAQFEVSSEGLRIRGDLWGRFIAASHLRVNDGRRVDFNAEPALRPRFRTMGTGMPGYSAGWHRLGNGERALVYLTDRSRAIYMPTDEGYSLVLSPDDPDKFLAALRSVR